MSAPAHDTRAEVAAVARILSRAGLVEAFGHVSARAGEGSFVITSTDPLGAATPATVVGPGDPRAPLETPMHAALYAGRPDVGAVCRTHSPAAVAWGARRTAPPLVHGLGGLAGEIATHAGADLVTDPAAGRAVAASLGEADCVLLAGNGAVCTGPDLATACVRALHLEERARVALAAGPTASPIEGTELQRRSTHFPAETARAWRWIAWRFLGADDHDVRRPGDPT